MSIDVAKGHDNDDEWLGEDAGLLLQDRRERTRSSRFHQYVTKQPPWKRLRRPNMQALAKVSLAIATRLSAEILPSFLSIRWLPHSGATRLAAPRKHATSWLDGLRGAAALAVVAFHWARLVLANVDGGYGEIGNDRAKSLLQLPIIRLAFSGLSNVAIFFVISGFALSVRPVQLMAQPHQNASVAMRSFASSVFRRFFRLYLPAWASTIVPFFWRYFWVSNRLGTSYMFRFAAYGSYRKAVEELHSPIYNQTATSGPPSASIAERDFSASAFLRELGKWAIVNLKSLTILEGSWPISSYENPFNAPMWTIPVEFRASLFVFLVQIAIYHFRPTCRVAVTVILILWSVYSMRFEMVLFLGGFLIAQLETTMLVAETKLRRSRTIWRLYTAFMVGVLTLGLYLNSYPMWGAEITPGFIWLSQHVPQYDTFKPWFWSGNGAILIVFSIGRLRCVANFFASPILQYFGQISFSIYLLHFLLLLDFGSMFIYHALNLTNNLDRHSYPMFVVAFIVATTGCYGLIVWLGDLWCRFVDIPSVRFAKWLETKCLW